MLDQAQDVAVRAETAIYDGIEGAAQETQSVAGDVQTAAAAATVVSAGAASPVAGPVATVAEGVADAALVVEVGVDYARDGKVDATVGSIVKRVTLGTAGNRARGAVSEQTAGSAQGKTVWDSTVDMFSSAVDKLFGSGQDK